MHRKVFQNKFIRRSLILVGWLFIWWLLSMWVGNGILFAGPYASFSALFSKMATVSFWRTVGHSAASIGAGFLFGALCGFFLAALAYRFVLVREVFSPFLRLCKSVPVASFVVLFLIWWGSSKLSFAICFFVVLPQMYVNVLEGFLSTDQKLLEVAKVYHLSLWRRFFYIYRESLRPFLESALELSLGMCWKSGVAAELIGTPRYSIGEQMYLTKISLDTAGLFAWTAVIIVLSVVFEKAVLLGFRKSMAWAPKIKKRSARGQKVQMAPSAAAAAKSATAGDEQAPAEQAQTLRIAHINKSYGNVSVLKDVTATYTSENITYLTSPSGRGKTTLLRILAGLESPDAGEITYGTARLPAISFLFQEDRLLETYSAVKNVALSCGDEAMARAELTKLLPKEALDKPCAQLSGGQKRRVALIRALLFDAAIVLLDEPFAGLDEASAQAAFAYIQEKTPGKILLISTHEKGIFPCCQGENHML